MLIERGHEVGGGDRRSRIGTMARLVSVSAGADALLAVAVAPIVSRSMSGWMTTPIPAPRSRHCPSSTGATSSPRFARKRRRSCDGHSPRAPEAQWDADTELSDDPIAAAWQLAAIAPLGDYDRYALLQSATVGALLRQIIDLTLDAELLWSDG